MNLRVLAEANAELDEATFWYERQRPGLGDELLLEIEEALVLIEELPKAWPTWQDLPELRYFVLQRFPYSIPYCLQGNAIVILAFSHTSRRPGYWLDRHERLG